MYGRSRRELVSVLVFFNLFFVTIYVDKYIYLFSILGRIDRIEFDFRGSVRGFVLRVDELF